VLLFAAAAAAADAPLLLLLLLLLLLAAKSACPTSVLLRVYKSGVGVERVLSLTRMRAVQLGCRRHPVFR
jgi:hypothetical protein